MVKEKIHKQFFPMLFLVLLILYVTTLIIPFIWLFLTSFKSKLDFIESPFLLPKKWHGENYINVFKQMFVPISTIDGFPRNVYLPELFLNSFIYSIGSTFVATFFHCISAYVVAKYKFKLGKIIYSLVIITMILPIVGSLPSSIAVYNAIGAYDNLFMIIFAQASFLGTNFLVFYATFRGISWEYAEAGFIDGASHAYVLFHIMLPLAKPTIFALGLMAFISYWNNWQVSMIYMPSFPLAAYALHNFQFNTNNSVTGLPCLTTACMMLFVPMIILFLIFKNKLIGSVTVGGLKG